MKRHTTFSFILGLLLVSLPLTTFGQESTAQKPERVRGVQYAEQADSATLAAESKEIPTFAGISLSADLAGATMAAISPWGSYEGACRVSIKHRWFPIVEAGIGVSNHTAEATGIHYKTRAPFFRMGVDYNLTKNRRSFGRVLGGVRYGFTSFKYDVSGPPLIDNTWGGEVPFEFSGIRANAHWCEAVFGLDAKIWRFVRLGWSLRYKLLLSQKKSQLGKAWYIPGYGHNDSHAIGGTMNITFEL